MKKKILSTIMTLAICLTVGYNYSAVKESTSLSNSLKQLATVEFAAAEDGGQDDCTAYGTTCTEESPCSCGSSDCSGSTTTTTYSESCQGNQGECWESSWSNTTNCDGSDGGSDFPMDEQSDC